MQLARNVRQLILVASRPLNVTECMVAGIRDVRNKYAGLLKELGPEAQLHK